MESIKISLCIPTMNRFDSFLEEYLKKYIQYLNVNTIDELIICDENGEDYKKIQNVFSQELETYSNFKIFRNEEVLGVFKNKLKVASLASHDYVALIDSDNFPNDGYFITMKKYITENVNNISKHCLFSPSFAKPNFNFKEFEGNIITKKNLKEFFYKPKFDILLNTGNYIVNKCIFEKINYNPNLLFRTTACDVLFFNLLAFQQFQDLQLHIVKDTEYTHVVHPGSIYMNTIHNCENYRDTVIKNQYKALLNDNK